MPKRVAKDVEWKAFFRKGEGFYTAALVLNSQNHDVLPHVATALVTCQAFAGEVYLKVLAGLENGLRPLQTHNTLHLFNALSPELRKRIEDEWNDKCLATFAGHRQNPNRPKWMIFPQSLRQALDLGAGAFIDWRYEGEDSPIQYHLWELVRIARSVVLEQKPDWLPRRTTMKAFEPGDPTGPAGWK